MKHTIWVEKWRPKVIADVIFQDERQEGQFKSFIADKDIPNLLLSGIQGTGKTTISKVLVRELGIDISDVMRINCSDKKIDTMRSEVTAFAQTIPMGKFKVVQLEEIDHLSLDAQALLRGLIEDSSLSCRWIATCNYENKVIPPLRSRFQHFRFKSPDKEVLALRMATILDAEGIDFDPVDLIIYIDVGYPDVRRIIQLIQSNSRGNKLLSPSSNEAAESDWKFGLLDALASGNFQVARKLICESASREEHEDVFTFLYQNIDKLKVKNKEDAILTIAEYMKAHSLSSDTELNLAACMIAISRC